MASRDNQGLQIAVILTVMLAVGLGITTGVFYNANAKAQADADAANQRAQSETAKARDYLMERNRLKVLIGHSEETIMEDIEKQFAADVASFIADENGTPADLQAMNYRKIPQELRTKYSSLEQQLATARAEQAKLQADLTTVRTTTTEQIEKAIAQQNQYSEELDKARKEYLTSRQSLQDQQKKVLAEKQAIEGQVAQVKSASEQEKRALQKTIDDLNRTTEGFLATVEGLKPSINDRPDGQIVWANQREKTVWINLGSADMLRPQMTFSVYERGESNLADATRKATIEITAIHERHQAEGRITEMSSSNPVMPGDAIFTPVWTPGRPEQFALVGFIDIDGDDRDDTQQLRQIIETAGGKVAAYVDEQGKIQGEITPDVRFLIRGDRPTERSSEGALQAYTQMSETARRVGVEDLRVDRFINWAGYVGAEELVRLNAASRLEEMEAQAEKERAGFQPRRPNGNSAF